MGNTPGANKSDAIDGDGGRLDRLETGHKQNRALVIGALVARAGVPQMEVDHAAE